MSIHVYKAQAKARKLGGMAGEPAAAELWELSKRELVELALRLTQGGKQVDISLAVEEVVLELSHLKQQGIL